MELVTPGLGLVFWMLVSFLLVLFILKKFAWKPILNALKERENTIAESLNSAEKAKEEMARLKADNEEIIAEAHRQKDRVMKDTKELANKLMSDTKERAAIEAAKMIDEARSAIESEKNAALKDIKDKIVILSVQIAEKILKEQLSKAGEQEQVVEKYIAEINLN